MVSQGIPQYSPYPYTSKPIGSTSEIEKILLANRCTLRRQTVTALSASFYQSSFGLAQRAAAAALAISCRCNGLSFAARAAPPLFPPSLPSATAAGFFCLGVTGSSGASPVAISTISFASWFASRGRVLERLGMSYLGQIRRGLSTAKHGGGFQKGALPPTAIRLGSPREPSGNRLWWNRSGGAKVWLGGGH
jgi:hypothetical protein